MQAIAGTAFDTLGEVLRLKVKDLTPGKDPATMHVEVLCTQNQTAALFLSLSVPLDEFLNSRGRISKWMVMCTANMTEIDWEYYQTHVAHDYFVSAAASMMGFAASEIWQGACSADLESFSTNMRALNWARESLWDLPPATVRFMLACRDLGVSIALSDMPEEILNQIQNSESYSLISSHYGVLKDGKIPRGLVGDGSKTLPGIQDVTIGHKKKTKRLPDLDDIALVISVFLCGMGAFGAYKVLVRYVGFRRHKVRGARHKGSRGVPASQTLEVIMLRVAASTALREALATENVARLAAAVKGAENVGVAKPLVRKGKNALHALRRRKLLGATGNSSGRQQTNQRTLSREVKEGGRPSLHQEEEKQEPAGATALQNNTIVSMQSEEHQVSYEATMEKKVAGLQTPRPPQPSDCACARRPPLSEETSSTDECEDEVVDTLDAPAKKDEVNAVDASTPPILESLFPVSATVAHTAETHPSNSSVPVSSKITTTRLLESQDASPPPPRFPKILRASSNPLPKPNKGLPPGGDLSSPKSTSTKIARESQASVETSEKPSVKYRLSNSPPSSSLPPILALMSTAGVHSVQRQEGIESPAVTDRTAKRPRTTELRNRDTERKSRTESSVLDEGLISWENIPSPGNLPLRKRSLSAVVGPPDTSMGLPGPDALKDMPTGTLSRGESFIPLPPLPHGVPTSWMPPQQAQESDFGGELLMPWSGGSSESLRNEANMPSSTAASFWQPAARQAKAPLETGVQELLPYVDALHAAYNAANHQQGSRDMSLALPTSELSMLFTDPSSRSLDLGGTSSGSGIPSSSASSDLFLSLQHIWEGYRGGGVSEQGRYNRGMWDGDPSSEPLLDRPLYRNSRRSVGGGSLEALGFKEASEDVPGG